jgi:hypothetical protein
LGHGTGGKQLRGSKQFRSPIIYGCSEGREDPCGDSGGDTYNLIVDALAKLIAAAGDACIMKPDLRAGDVILLFAGFFQMDPTTDWKAQSTRLYRYVLEGLQADGASD